MTAPTDPLAIGAVAAVGNCAYYFREQANLPAAAEQMEAVESAIDELIEANRLLLASRPPHMCHRNAKEREAYRRIQAALVRVVGTAEIQADDRVPHAYNRDATPVAVTTLGDFDATA